MARTLPPRLTADGAVRPRGLRPPRRPRPQRSSTL